MRILRILCIRERQMGQSVYSWEIKRMVAPFKRHWRHDIPHESGTFPVYVFEIKDDDPVFVVSRDAPHCAERLIPQLFEENGRTKRLLWEGRSYADKVREAEGPKRDERRLTHTLEESFA